MYENWPSNMFALLAYVNLAEYWHNVIFGFRPGAHYFEMSKKIASTKNTTVVNINAKTPLDSYAYVKQSVCSDTVRPLKQSVCSDTVRPLGSNILLRIKHFHRSRIRFILPEAESGREMNICNLRLRCLLVATHFTDYELNWWHVVTMVIPFSTRRTAGSDITFTSFAYKAMVWRYRGGWVVSVSVSGFVGRKFKSWRRHFFDA